MLSGSITCTTLGRCFGKAPMFRLGLDFVVRGSGSSIGRRGHNDCAQIAQIEGSLPIENDPRLLRPRTEQHGFVGVQQLVGGNKLGLEFRHPPGHRIKCISLIFRGDRHPSSIPQRMTQTQQNRHF